MIRLTDTEFQEIVSYIKNNYGINLINKRQLIEARMFSALTEKGLNNFTDYFALIKQNNSAEITTLLNRLTTNHTYFMREQAHFDFFKRTILPMHEKTNRQKNIRIWSAGCSSGEEAFTTIMVMMDYFGMRAKEWDCRILATDISEKVMQAAQTGVYTADSLKNVPADWTRKYFTTQDSEHFLLHPEVRNQVIFKKFNLMEPFVYRAPFDLIFCRNVMIYFDQPTRNKLIQKFYDVLKPGGYLFIGHSETIPRDSSPFCYVEPSVYQKG